MKKILLIFFYLNVLTAQSNKYEFFLKNNGINLDLIGDKGIIIRKELDDILKQTNEENNLEIKNFWKIQYTEKEYVGTSFDKWGYAERILLYNNPTQMDAAIEKRNFTREVYENVKKEKNRIFERGTLLFKIKIKWEDLTSKNSYSQLVEKGINKNNLSKLDISVILDKIELINSSTCLAHVKINGTDEALKYHSIPKNIYKYKGNYKFKKPVYNYIDLIDDSRFAKLVEIQFNFDKKKYLPEKYTSITINEKSITPSIFKQKSATKLLLDDQISTEMFLKYHTEYQTFENEYKLLRDKKWAKPILNGINYSYTKKDFSEDELYDDIKYSSLIGIKNKLVDAKYQLYVNEKKLRSQTLWYFPLAYSTYLIILGILPPA